jgi:hypothetical protein
VKGEKSLNSMARPLLASILGFIVFNGLQDRGNEFWLPDKQRKTAGKTATKWHHPPRVVPEHRAPAISNYSQNILFHAQSDTGFMMNVFDIIKINELIVKTYFKEISDIIDLVVTQDAVSALVQHEAIMDWFLTPIGIQPARGKKEAWQAVPGAV